jgi:hypothetical protein
MACVGTITNISEAPRLRKRRRIYDAAAHQVLAILYVSGRRFRDVAPFLAALDDAPPTDDDASALGRILQQGGS